MPVTSAVIRAAYEVPYTRHPSRDCTTEAVLANAVRGVLHQAGVAAGQVDGLGVSSFSLRPDHAIDLAWRLGLGVRWLMQDPHGGASAINLLQHAVRAVEAGDASCIVLVSGDHLDRAAFAALTDNYNKATLDCLTPMALGGPNALFALLTKQHMADRDLGIEDYAQIPLVQRRWAERNPGAVYRTRLCLDAYLTSEVIADPLRVYDCVPVVTGADAILVTADRSTDQPAVRVSAFVAAFNHDGQEGTGLSTGLAPHREEFWDTAGFGPEEIDLACVYDDYPVMVLVQLSDLGLVEPGDERAFLNQRLGRDTWPLNPSGGQLSAGQAGAAGGMHGLVESVQHLLGHAGERQVVGARRALVTGYGMVLYRYGGCANAVALEAS